MSTVALPLSTDDRKQGWRMSMLDGAFHAIHSALTYGPFMPAFGLLLGASPFQLGVLGAITQLAMVGAAVLDRLPVRRKPMAMWAAAVGRYLWIAMAVLPLLAIGSSTKVLLFLGLYALSSLLLQTAGLAWLDWIGDLIDGEVRGRYFAWRNAMVTGLTMICTAMAGPWLDHHKAGGQEAWGFTSMLLLATLAAIAARWTIARQPDPIERPHTETSHMAPATPVWKSFLWFIGCWLLVAGIAGPFYTAYALQSLHMDYQAVAHWSILGNLTGMITQPLLGHHVDGGRRNWIMIGSAALVTGLPLLWLVARPDQLWTVWLDGLLNGIVWTAFTLCQTHIVLQICPPQGRRRHLGIYTAITGLANGLASLIGGWLIGHHWTLPLNGPPLLFALTSVGRAVCTAWLIVVIWRWRTTAKPRTYPSATAIPDR